MKNINENLLTMHYMHYMYLSNEPITLGKYVYVTIVVNNILKYQFLNVHLCFQCICQDSQDDNNSSKSALHSSVYKLKFHSTLSIV